VKHFEYVWKFALRVCSKSWSCDHITLLDSLSNRREPWNCVCCYRQICTPFLPIRNFKHTPYASHHRNTVQLVVPQAHCNQFKDLFVLLATERWKTFSTLIKMASIYTSFQTHHCVKFINLGLITWKINFASGRELYHCNFTLPMLTCIVQIVSWKSIHFHGNRL